MSLHAAEIAAGVPLHWVGDGVSVPTWVRPQGFPYLYVHAADQYPVTCVGAAGSSAKQTVTTPEGVHLGDSTARVRAVYGTRASFYAKPNGGMDPRPGYVVYERGGELIFKVDDANTTVIGIVGGPLGLTPSDCGG